jgi:hypothetical protein
MISSDMMKRIEIKYEMRNPLDITDNSYLAGKRGYGQTDGNNQWYNTRDQLLQKG